MGERSELSPGFNLHNVDETSIDLNLPLQVFTLQRQDKTSFEMVSAVLNTTQGVA